MKVTKIKIFNLLFLFSLTGFAFLRTEKTQAAVIAQYSGGLVVHSDTATMGTPKYKTFDDTSGFGSEQSASSVGSNAIEYIRVASCPTRDEWIIATRDSGDVIKAQVCTGVDGGVSCGTPTTITSTAGTHGFRNFDVEYEMTSGDALLVYGTATDDELRKIEWGGSSWASDASITTTRTTGAVEWVELTSRSGSDQIGIAYSDTNDDVSAYRWDGSAASDETTAVITATASTADVRKFDVSFEGSSGDMLVIAQVNAAGTWASGQLVGTTWTVGNQTGVDNIGAFIDIANGASGTDDLAIVSSYTNVFEGAEWSGTAIVDGAVAVDTSTGTWASDYHWAAASYVNSTYNGVAVYEDTTGTDDINWMTMNSSGTWTAQTDNTRTRGTSAIIESYDYPNADKVIVFTEDANSDLWADTWDGSTPSSTVWSDMTSGGALETDLTSATRMQFDFAFRLAPMETTVSASGTQTSGMIISSTNNYVGGKFVIIESGGSSRNVTGITIAEQGTIDGQANLDNIKLYYESDTSSPYNCASESLSSPSSPTESQFGSTDTDGFSAANGASAFSGSSVGISTTSTMCVYVVLDVGSGASNGNTIEIQITTPSSDVTVSSGGIGPVTAVLISGTTTIMTTQVVGTLGKVADGWSGAVPVYMELIGIDQASYSYARAQVTTVASQTFYTDMTWDSGDSRYEGTIYPGSNICMGCDDPKTYNGSFSVTVQLDNNTGFPSVDYSDSAGTFIIVVMTKRTSMDAVQATNYTDYNAIWSTDHWNISISDFGFAMRSGTGTNIAVAVPIHPVTSSPSNFTVAFNGSSVSGGSAESTSNAWWWESDSHTLYLQFASLTTTLVDVDITFDNDTDLFATRYNWTQTYDMGQRSGSNGLYIANRYLTTFIYPRPLSTADNNIACTAGNECEQAGMQAESRAHQDGGPDESTDCMERVAVHVDDTARSDGTGAYQNDIKWYPEEYADWITSESNSGFTIVNHSDSTASTGWAQQLNNSISATRTLNIYAGERYIKNVYEFTNNDSSSHKYPMVWEREQWHGTDRATNDSGRFYGDTSDRTVEERISLSSFTCPWQTAYDTGTFINMGLIYDQNNLPDYGIFAVEPFLGGSTPYYEWPIVITEDHATNTADQTGFEKTWATVAADETVSFTFWHVHNAESSWADIDTAMDADCDEVNSSTIISITISDGTIGYGQVLTSEDTTSSGINDTQTITNNGNVAEDFEIMGQDSANWALGASAGDAIYKHEWCTSSCDSSPTWNTLTEAYQTLATNIGVSSTQDFDLQVTVPTVNQGSNQQDVSVTVRAIEH